MISSKQMEFTKSFQESFEFYNQNQCNEMHYKEFMLILIPFWRVVQLWMFEQKGWLPAVFWMNWWCQKYVITVQIRSSHHSSLSGTNWKTNGVEDHHSWKISAHYGALQDPDQLSWWKFLESHKSNDLSWSSTEK